MRGKVSRVEDASHGLSRYTGDLSEEARNGVGCMRYANGEVYLGEWRGGRRCGQGVYYYADGAVYDGAWDSDKAHGSGVCRYPTGNIYSGEWHHGRVSGRGAMFYSDGDAYDGEWSEGRLHGHGRFYNSNGEVHSGQWYEDQAIQSTTHTTPNKASPRLAKSEIASRRHDVTQRSAIVDAVKPTLMNFVSLQTLATARAELAHAPFTSFDREPTIPVTDIATPQQTNPLAFHSPEVAQMGEDASDDLSGDKANDDDNIEESDSESSGIDSSFTSDEETRGHELERVRGYFDRVKREQGGNLTWADLARQAERDKGSSNLGVSTKSIQRFQEVVHKRSSAPHEASWDALRDGIESNREHRRLKRQRSRQALNGSPPSARKEATISIHGQGAQEGDDDTLSVRSSVHAFSETKSDDVGDSEEIRLPLHAGDVPIEAFSTGDLGLWRQGEASAAQRPPETGVTTPRGPMPHGSPDRSIAVEKVLSMCGPADEPFSFRRFTHLFAAMLVPYPFMSCSPFALNTESLERKYVVSGAAPRWVDEPGDYLCYSYVVVPLIVIMFTFAFAGDDDEVTAASDVVLPPAFLLLFTLTIAAKEGFPRRTAHFLESLPDAQFNLLAGFTYSKMRETAKIDESWEVVWSDNSYGGGRFVFIESRNILGCMLGVLVGMAIPVHRLINGDSMWGDNAATRVVTATGSAAIWLTCMGLYGSIISVIHRQRQLLSQLSALIVLADLTTDADKVVFDLSVTGLTDSLFSPNQIEDLRSVLGWYICRSFVLHGSPVMNHNSRSAVISVNIFAVICVSFLLCTTFLYNAIVDGHPTITDPSYTTASVFLLITSPLVFYNIWLWKRVSYCYKKHRLMMSSASTCKLVRVCGPGGEVLVQEANLITGLADYITKHDIYPRVLGLRVTSWTILLLGLIISGAVGTLIFRWIQFGYDTDTTLAPPTPTPVP